jgi:hypothetical protein
MFNDYEIHELYKVKQQELAEISTNYWRNSLKSSKINPLKTLNPFRKGETKPCCEPSCC